MVTTISTALAGQRGGVSTHGSSSQHPAGGNLTTAPPLWVATLANPTGEVTPIIGNPLTGVTSRAIQSHILMDTTLLLYPMDLQINKCFPVPTMGILMPKLQLLLLSLLDLGDKTLLLLRISLALLSLHPWMLTSPGLACFHITLMRESGRSSLRTFRKGKSAAFPNRKESATTTISAAAEHMFHQGIERVIAYTPTNRFPQLESPQRQEANIRSFARLPLSVGFAKGFASF
jgi:hypothetical protein